jgi:hypothetical protein
MRYCMQMRANQSSGRQIVIVAKKNNWRAKSSEVEMPDCLDYVAREHLRKVGDEMIVGESEPTFRMLARYLKGEDPETVEITKAADTIAQKLLDEFGFLGQVRQVCVRMRKKGMDNPLAETLLTTQVFKLMKERVKASA